MSNPEGRPVCKLWDGRPESQRLMGTVRPLTLSEASRRLIPVRATASCKCGSQSVAWFRSPATNRWALHDVIEHPSPTVSGMYLDIDHPHQCGPVESTPAGIAAAAIWQDLEQRFAGDIPAMRTAWWTIQDELSQRFFRTVER